MYPFKRFTESAKEVLTLAQAEAEAAHHSYIGTEHLLVGLMQERSGLGGKVLQALGIQLPAVRIAIEGAVAGRGERMIKQRFTPTSRVKRVIEIAFEEALRDRQRGVGTGYLLLVLLVEGEGVAAHVLRDLGVTVETARREITRLQAEAPEEAAETQGGAGPRHRQLDLATRNGQRISVLVIFPPDFSEEECEAVASRIREAVTDT